MLQFTLLNLCVAIHLQLCCVAIRVYDMGAQFLTDMEAFGVPEAKGMGGLPSWSLLLRRV